MSVPHLSLPLRVVDGSYAVNEQNTRAEIEDCVSAILRFPQGYRIERPSFGLPDQTFRQGGADLAAVAAAVARWEPRANALTSGELEGLVSRVRVTVTGGAE